MEDFYKPKLFYADITQRLNFSICKEVMFCNNTTYFIAAENKKLLEHLGKCLNSPLIDWYYRTLSVQLGEKAVRMFSIYVLEIPIPPITKKDIYDAFDISLEAAFYAFEYYQKWLHRHMAGNQFTRYEKDLMLLYEENSQIQAVWTDPNHEGSDAICK